jgi:hypothetical protein
MYFYGCLVAKTGGDHFPTSTPMQRCGALFDSRQAI